MFPINILLARKKTEEVTIPVPNAGAAGTGDWLNPTAGLAEFWSAVGSQTDSIVTGNGFTGNAQRMYKTTTSGMSILSDVMSVGGLFSYKLAFTARADVGNAFSISILDSTSSLIYNEILNINNIGNALPYTTSAFTVTDTQIIVVFGTNAIVADLFMEMDEAKLILQ
jgi:hypothetical protein